MKEPLHNLFEKYGFNINLIDKIVTGEKYTAVILKNGNIGVCGNPKHKLGITKTDLAKIDLSNFEHRVLLTAYFNAQFNYDINFNCENNILEKIKSGGYQQVVMIGYFETLVDKFLNEDINLTVFDFSVENPAVTPMEKQKEFLNKADAVILTATSIANETFLGIVENTKTDCDIYIIGPSSIMHTEMFNYKNVKKILGSVFEPNDERILNMIDEGFAPKDFLKFGKKVCFTR